MHKKMLAATFVTFSLLGIVNDSKAMDRLTTCLNASLTPRPLNLANNQIPVVLPINALTQTTTTAAQLTDLSSSSEMHSDTFEGSNIGNSPEIISSPEESLTEPPAKRPKTAHPMADFIEKLSLSQRKKAL